MDFKIPFYAFLLVALLILPHPSNAQDKAIPDDLEYWAYAAISDVADFTYLNADDRIKYIRRYFTEIGYKSYMLALQRSRSIDMIKADQGVAIGRALCIQNIEYTPKENVDFYTVKAPFVFRSNANALGDREDYFWITVLIKHDSSINENGYGIYQWITESSDLNREKADRVCNKVRLEKYNQHLK